MRHNRKRRVLVSPQVPGAALDDVHTDTVRVVRDIRSKVEGTREWDSDHTLCDLCAQEASPFTL